MKKILLGVSILLIVAALFGNWIVYNFNMLKDYGRWYIVAQIIETKYPFVEIAAINISSDDGAIVIFLFVDMEKAPKKRPEMFYTDLMKIPQKFATKENKFVVLFMGVKSDMNYVYFSLVCPTEAIAKNRTLIEMFEYTKGWKYPCKGLMFVIPFFEKTWPPEPRPLNPYIYRILGHDK